MNYGHVISFRVLSGPDHNLGHCVVLLLLAKPYVLRRHLDAVSRDR
jgi:hypothetical protein